MNSETYDLKVFRYHEKVNGHAWIKKKLQECRPELSALLINILGAEKYLIN